MQVRGCSLAPGDRSPHRAQECVAWRRVTEKDSGHLLWNGPTTSSTSEYINSHHREVLMQEWWCPSNFYRALQAMDHDAPIIGLDQHGNECSTGPFWAGRPNVLLEQLSEVQEEVSNAGHQSDLQRCHHRLIAYLRGMRKGSRTTTPMAWTSWNCSHRHEWLPMPRRLV